MVVFLGEKNCPAGGLSPSDTKLACLSIRCALSMYINRVFSERFLTCQLWFDCHCILVNCLGFEPPPSPEKMFAKDICSHLTPSLNTFFKAYLEFLFDTLQWSRWRCDCYTCLGVDVLVWVCRMPEQGVSMSRLALCIRSLVSLSKRVWPMFVCIHTEHLCQYHTCCRLFKY